MAKAKPKPITTDKLVEDLHTVVRDAEELLKVTASQAGSAYSLSADNLRRLEREDPQVAAVLHRFLLKRVGRRLLNALETVDALAE